MKSYIINAILTFAATHFAASSSIPPVQRIKLRKSELEHATSLRAIYRESNETNLVGVSFNQKESRIHLKLTSPMYTAQISLGHPAQEFTVLIDTGSGQLWVPSSLCDNPGCNGKRLFLPERSSHFQNDGSPNFLRYGSGEVLGYLGRDEFLIGDTRVDNFPFTQATEIFEDFARLKMDGLLGLGPGMNELDVLFTLKRRNILPLPLFSLYFYPMSGSDTSGELILGGIDGTKYVGDLIYARVRYRNFWTVKLDEISVETSDRTPGRESHTDINTICNPAFQECEGLFDTGSNVMCGPAEQVEALNYLIGAPINQYGQYIFSDCTQTGRPNVIIRVSGKAFKMAASDYMWPVVTNLGTRVCISRFTPTSDKRWVLGLPFIENHYVVFDYGKMELGLAELKKEF